MNSIVSNHNKHQYERPRLHDLSEIAKHELSKAQGSRIASDKLKQLDTKIDYSLKGDSMFNRVAASGSKAGGRGDKSNSGDSSSFQRHPASNSGYHSFVNSPALNPGLVVGSTEAAQRQQNPSSLATQSQALAQQQQRLLQMTKNELEVQQMASNIKESLLIKRRLESIQHLQQQEANKLRGELQMKSASEKVTPSGMGRQNSISMGGFASSATKHVPSTSNRSVLPTKQREDEMTKPDLSTLAETAVAVASAYTHAQSRSSSTGMIGIGSIMKRHSSNNSGNNQIAALLGRQGSSMTATESTASQSMPTIASSLANNAMTGILRRDMNSTKLNLEHNYKRSIDEITKSNTTDAPPPSSWLWKPSTLGSSTPILVEQLHARQDHLQRRNSLPAPTSATVSEIASLRSLKRQRLLEQKTSEIRGLEFHDAMNQMRKMDASMNSSLLAEMASKIASQERRASIASSIASVGTSATAPNLTTNPSFPSPVGRRNHIMLESTFDHRSKVLSKLSKMGGGFPMPKFKKGVDGMKSSIPAEITPELGKDVVDIMGRDTSSLSSKQQLENDRQSRYLERIGGFPMPPLYRQIDEIRDQYDGAVSISESGTRGSNAISSHIRNNVNRSGTKASRPPALESYKRVWRDIRVVAGDDPLVDERLRKEVFARKLQRGEILAGKTGSGIMNSMNNHYVNTNVLQRRLSDLSHSSVNASISGGRTKCGAPADESIVI
jgi:hypothetical protein